MSEEVTRYKNSVRKERAALLVWFLINYYRLDEDTAVYSVCDDDNDKGIDGIFVDDLTQEVYIFQSKNSQKPANPQGDHELKEFAGSQLWFAAPENIEALGQSIANQQLKALVKELEVFDRLRRDYKLKMVFVTNRRFDQHANDYLPLLGDNIEAWDIDRLFIQYTFTGKYKPVKHTFEFELEPNNSISYSTREGAKVIVFPAKATDIAALQGIQDRTLFAKNVRYGLGRTRVNKEIEKTLRSKAEHENFFLYHNGITVVCERFEPRADRLDVVNYSVVNGCQSTLSFYENQNELDPQVKVLLRVIQTGNRDNMSQQITFSTNNQNAISFKDLKSNDKIQEDLQAEFKKVFHNQLFFQIKAGEDVTNYNANEIIDNEFSAQLITSFYLKESHIAHQKTHIFTDNYNRIFNRNITAVYIFLLREMYNAIESNKNLIEDEGIRSYGSTRFFFIYVFRLIFESDLVGKEFLENPSAFYKKYKDRYYDAFVKLFKLLALDFNYHVTQEKDKSQGFFDYKNVLRNSAKVRDMAEEMVLSFKRQLIRHPEDSFEKLIST